MSTLSVPDGAVGRVGMVAALKRLGEARDGTLVIVRSPVGFVSELVGSPTPVFSWQVETLSGPINCNGKPARSIYVPDCCLVPVTDLPEAEMTRLVETQHREDFDRALAEARIALDAQSLTEAEFDRVLEKAATQALLGKALETVPVQVALHDIGFKPRTDGLDGAIWVGVHDGTELTISACPDWICNWRLAANAKTRRTLVCDERVVPNELPRGEVFLIVLKMWRNAFGREVIPDCLQLGAMYERHIQEMRILNPGLPTLWVDPKVFRMMLKWLADGQRALWNDNDTAEVSFSEGLWIGAKGIVYGCPARGHWTTTCTIRIADLIGLREVLDRVRGIRLEQSAECLFVNGCELALVEVDTQ